jgi:hypothetical protein
MDAKGLWLDSAAHHLSCFRSLRRTSIKRVTLSRYQQLGGLRLARPSAPFAEAEAFFPPQEIQRIFHRGRAAIYGRVNGIVKIALQGLRAPRPAEQDPSPISFVFRKPLA